MTKKKNSTKRMHSVQERRAKRNASRNRANKERRGISRDHSADSRMNFGGDPSGRVAIGYAVGERYPEFAHCADGARIAIDAGCLEVFVSITQPTSEEVTLFKSGSAFELAAKIVGGVLVLYFEFGGRAGLGYEVYCSPKPIVVPFLPEVGEDEGYSLIVRAFDERGVCLAQRLIGLSTEMSRYIRGTFRRMAAEPFDPLAFYAAGEDIQECYSIDDIVQGADCRFSVPGREQSHMHMASPAVGSEPAKPGTEPDAAADCHGKGPSAPGNRPQSCEIGQCNRATEDEMRAEAQTRLMMLLLSAGLMDGALLEGFKRGRACPVMMGCDEPSLTSGDDAVSMMFSDDPRARTSDGGRIADVVSDQEKILGFATYFAIYIHAAFRASSCNDIVVMLYVSPDKGMWDMEREYLLRLNPPAFVADLDYPGVRKFGFAPLAGEASDMSLC